MGAEPASAKKICDRGEMVSKKHSNGRLNDDDFVAYIVEQSSPALEYVGGYSGRMRPITVRNRNCGHEYSANYHSVVHKGSYTFCPICYEERVSRNKMLRTALSQEKRTGNCRSNRRRCDRSCLFLVYTAVPCLSLRLYAVHAVRSDVVVMKARRDAGVGLETADCIAVM